MAHPGVPLPVAAAEPCTSQGQMLVPSMFELKTRCKCSSKSADRILSKARVISAQDDYMLAPLKCCH